MQTETMQTETMLQLALITASLQVVIQLLGVFKGLIDWKVARENAESKKKTPTAANGQSPISEIFAKL